MILPNILPALPSRLVVGLLSVVLGAAAGAWGGWAVGRAPLQVDLAEQRATSAETGRLRAMAAARALTAAQDLGNQLTTRLADSHAQITTLQKDKADAIRLVTTGRPCLSGSAVRVLNGPAADRDATADLPAPTSGPDAADGAFATDTDVGLWIGHAQGQYDTCRTRLDALIDFVQGQPVGAAID